MKNQTTGDFEVNDYVTVHVDLDHSYHGHVVTVGPESLIVKRWDDASETDVSPSMTSWL
jgi:hypothetical protein